MKKYLVFICVILATAALVMGCSTGRTARNFREPGMNVLLVTIDTLRADQLGCYGQEITKTPAMDAFAEQGVLFEQAFPTIPITGSSIFSVLTSRFPPNSYIGSGIHKRMGEPGFETIGQVLKKKGYTTVAVSGHPLLYAGSPYAVGFDEFIDTGSREALPSEETAKTTIEVLSRLSGENRKFFTWVHFMDPHRPFTPPDEYDVYRGIRGDPLMRQAAQWPEALKQRMKKSIIEAGQGDSLRVKYPDAYRGEITYTDNCVSMIIQELEKLGIADNTLVVLTADHGITFGQKDMYTGYVYTIYQDVIRVPLIVRFPGGLRGKRIPGPVSLMDIMPTILETAGADTGNLRMEGISLVPHLKGETPEGGRRIVFSQTSGISKNKLRKVQQGQFKEESWHRHALPFKQGQWTMAATGKFKLLQIPTPDGMEYELYNLENDPGERKDIASRQKGVVKSLTKSIERFKKQLNVETQKLKKMDVTVEKKASSASKADPETMKRLKSLGYIE